MLSLKANEVLIQNKFIHNLKILSINSIIKKDRTVDSFTVLYRKLFSSNLDNKSVVITFMPYVTENFLDS